VSGLATLAESLVSAGKPEERVEELQTQIDNDAAENLYCAAVPARPPSASMQSPPPYTKPEIERRWLVLQGSSFEALAKRTRRIEDRYLDGTRLRLRRVTEHGCAPIYKLGKKYETEGTGMHHVVTTYLTEAEFQLLASLPARVAHKTRFNIAGGALDVYEYPCPGLRIFEVEFSSLEEAAVYVPPPGMGQEVTHESSFTGHALAGAT
jgi:CYTH domain-containing protein